MMRADALLTARAVVAALATLIPATVGADVELPLANAGFEQLAADHSIAGWRLVKGVSSDDATTEADTETPRAGIGSLRLAVRGHGTATVESEPVVLEVGQLYRLSGWIRSSGVVSDPTSRYPTAVPACLTMASFPFTNHSPAVGGDADWTRVETLFLATQSSDRVRLHLGFNGTARGTAWFDDLRLEKVDDITEFIPMETVRWFGEGYRYDDRGWIFVHVEGEPYERGYQFGFLVADEIVSYISKLAILENRDDPEAGWTSIRFKTNSLFLRGYDAEYLTEMKGIADGAAHAGAEYGDRPLELEDIVAVNSVVDLGQLEDAIELTPHGLTGESFLRAEDELLIDEGSHKCSAFAATGPATRDGQVVFGQIFMWYGYTGVHWNVICDVVPTDGHRLVYHTFPGGIHSGSDFYINSAGIVIGETTVAQTPYDPSGTPQSNRIRKAAQYADSIDDVERILTTDNNGMYTNDWPIADVKTGEVAILLLGTEKHKLWRTGEDMAPFGTPGFLWANNNNRDPEVRKEYLAQPNDRPFDLIFGPWNRDLAFNQFYREHAGEIDARAAVELWASSPVNRAHACDGKITTTEMAERMVFLAHYGKVTLREKFPHGGYRIMPDLPDAIPHLSLGYSVASPVWVTEQLKRARPVAEPHGTPPNDDDELELHDLADSFAIDARQLWRQTVYPASDRENWFISGSAGYWRLLGGLDADDPAKAAEQLADELASLNARYLYTVSREQDLPAVDAHRAYDRYGPYQIPRIKGTYALHQLRLVLGNERFLELMRTVHERFARREMTNGDFVAVATEVTGVDVAPLIRQWIERQGLPKVRPSVDVRQRRGTWEVTVRADQQGEPYHLVAHIEVDAGGVRYVRQMEFDGSSSEARFQFDARPSTVVFNALRDFPVELPDFYTWGNFIDDFHDTLIVYGTARQDEANHTLARRWQETAANAYVEILPPLVKDSELTLDQASSHDLMVIGALDDNSWFGRLDTELPVEFNRNSFRWRGSTYAEPDDGLFLVMPNPFNPERVVYLFAANSALQLHQMTKNYHRGLPSWAVFKGEEVVDEGYHELTDFHFEEPFR
jgi:hypothetical protein